MAPRRSVSAAVPMEAQTPDGACVDGSASKLRRSVKGGAAVPLHYFNAQIDRKAKTMAKSLRMGKGAVDYCREILTRGIGAPCPFCRTYMTLGNVELDHSHPLRTRNARQSRILRQQHFDQPKNLELVCGKCNRLKSDLTPEDFRVLLAFMARHPVLGANLKRRLGHEQQWWALRKGGK